MTIEKKKVLNLSFFDYSGAGHRYSEALNRVGKYDCSSLKIFPHRFGYKNDFCLGEGFYNQHGNRISDLERWKNIADEPEEYKKRKAFAQNLIDEADIIHLQGDDSILHWNSREKFESAYGRHPYPGLFVPPEKPIIITTIGVFFRRRFEHHPGEHGRNRDPISVVAAHTNARTVDTLDLNYPEFDSEWLPFALDTKPVKNLWLDNNHDIPLIGHSPSSRTRKGTNTKFIPAMEILKKRGIKFEVDIIDGVSYEEVLERKKHLSLFFDSFQFGWYCCSTPEACQYGIPSVGWLSDFSFSQMKEEDKNIPIFSMKETPESLANVIIKILESDMSKISKQTKQWVDNTHSYEAVGSRLGGIIDRIV